MLLTSEREGGRARYLAASPRMNSTSSAKASGSRDKSWRGVSVVPKITLPNQGTAHSTRPSSVLRTSKACRSEEHTSELQSLMRLSYAVFCLKNKTQTDSSNTH